MYVPIFHKIKYLIIVVNYDLKSIALSKDILIIMMVESTVAETSWCIFIRVLVSLGNNLAGVAFVISSALLRACNSTRFVFTHLSLPCSVCGDSSGDL